MSGFLIIAEKGDDKYFPYSPGLLGRVANGKTCEEAEENMHGAIAFHTEGLK
ncbi:type II toxin-antitoxin system HicB family antitoxin [Methanoplanus limicola]|uniref:HicB-like antitoxin of toxin-antitoxin system domain-containing protein n=1 Tax=Methanoplanus limicola DSM 2279 TaxID=937775 RepID=H1Z0P4_9EURY|nr:type II toxin-antitoxin system HicB family antitoxin [Methanoplanus limicola]EHQ35301.1 hypothetical protein Metlim_1190 [Methanoplanus limicola DSM 2279]